jgi:hypothetical protein
MLPERASPIVTGGLKGHQEVNSLMERERARMNDSRDDRLKSSGWQSYFISLDMNTNLRSKQHLEDRDLIGKTVSRRGYLVALCTL